MSSEQKGFIVYGDIQDVLNELPDEMVAQLFRGMVDYFVDGTDPKFTGELKIAFIPIKKQMDRNALKYKNKCERLRENANKRWNDANASNSMQLHPNARNININTNINTNTNTDIDTTTTTTTDTDTTCGGGGCDDDIRKRLSADDMDVIWEKYPNTGGDLVDAVAADVKAKKKHVADPVPYILGYAAKVGWDDSKEVELEWSYTT